MTDVATILAAWSRLLAAWSRLLVAKRATYAAPPVGDIDATMADMAARAEVAPVVTAWTLDAKVRT